MKAEELAVIKERAEKATDGNWRATLDDPYERTHVLGAFNGTVSVIADIKGDDDAQFIANAREDVPKLVAEVERLRAELQRIAHGKTMSHYLSGAAMAQGLKRIAREALA